MRKAFKTVFMKEMKSILRNGMGVVVAVLVPLILFPVIITIILSVQKDIEDNISTPLIALYLQDESESININHQSTRYLEEFYYIDEFVLQGLEPQYVLTDDLQREFIYERVDIAIFIDINFMEHLVSGTFGVRVIYNVATTKGASVSNHVIGIIAQFSQKLTSLRLEAIGSSLEEITGVSYDLVTLQDAFLNQRVEGLNNPLLNMLVPILIIGFISMGSNMVSSELFAKERHRNTLESLLATTANRSGILLGKFAVCIVFGLLGALTQVASLFISVILNYSFFENSIYFEPSSIIALTLGVISLSILAATLGVFVQVFAKSYKSSESMTSILSIGPTILSYLLLLVSIHQVTLPLMFIPFIGNVLALKISTMGAIELGFLIISGLVNVVFSVFLGYLIVKRYHTEKILEEN